MQFSSFGLTDRIKFFGQLAALLNAGLSLRHSLQLAGKDCSQPFQRYLAQVSAKVATGSGLATALASVSPRLDDWTIGLVQLAETSGALAGMCQGLAIAAERQKRQQKLERSIALSSLAVILSGGLLLLALLPLGQLLFRQPSFWFLSVVVLLGLGVVAVLQPQVLSAIASKLLSLFPVGQQIATARTMLDLSELALPLQCGVPLLTAVDLLRDRLPNPSLKSALAVASQSIRRGQPLSRSLSGKIPSTALQFIRTGEETGHLDEMFEKIAAYYEGELERLLRQLQGVLQPLSVVAGGGVVLVLGWQLVRSLLDALPG